MKKTVLITGASSGIGKETALNLLNEGFVVYAAARRLEKMEELKARGAHVVKMDITSDKDIINVTEQIFREQQKLDVLVNNAGYAVYGAVEDTSIEDARRQFEVNLFGLARLTQLILPQMRKQGSGTIINMSSMGGKIYTPMGAWYHATKYALEGWSDCLRLELKEFNINVVIIEPGGIKTEFDEVMAKPLEKRSGSSAYSNQAKKTIRVTKKMYEGHASSPSVIADTILKAIHSKKPKHRYAKGFMAKPAILVRTVLGSGVWDWLLRRDI